MRRPEVRCGVLVLGVALLLGSLFLGWYHFRFDGIQAGPAGASSTRFWGEYVFLPGTDFRTGASCQGDATFCSTFNPTGFSGIHPYANPGPGYVSYPATGRVYEAVFGLVAGGAALAAVAAGLGLTGRGGASRRQLLIVGVAFALAVSAPTLVWVQTSSATGTDYHTPPNMESGNFTGPAGSFSGSCSTPSCGSGGGVTDSWGPQAGWYVAWIGAATLGVATLMIFPRPMPNAATESAPRVDR
jgi:hypothetical protein